MWKKTKVCFIRLITSTHLSGKFLNKNSIWNTKKLLPDSSWIALFHPCHCTKSILMRNKIRILRTQMGSLTCCQTQFVSKVLVLRGCTKGLHHPKSWGSSSSWQSKGPQGAVWWDSQAKPTGCCHQQRLLLSLLRDLSPSHVPATLPSHIYKQNQHVKVPKNSVRDNSFNSNSKMLDCLKLNQTLSHPLP